MCSSIQNYQILEAPNFEYPFILCVDASDYAAGAMVCQIYADNDGKRRFHYIEMGNKKFTQLQKNGWHSTEKEVWSVAYFLDRYHRYFLSGKQRHHVYTDAELLKRLFEKNQPNSKMMRYRYRISAYNIQVHHIPGSLNHIPDFLSRHTNGLKYEVNKLEVMQEINEWPSEEIEFYEPHLEIETEHITLNLNNEIYSVLPESEDNPICPECYHTLYPNTVYNMNGYINDECNSCHDVIRKSEIVHHCLNSGQHKHHHLICQECSKNKCDSWKQHKYNFQYYADDPYQPIHKHHRKNLHYSTNLNCHHFEVTSREWV